MARLTACLLALVAALSVGGFAPAASRPGVNPQRQADPIQAFDTAVGKRDPLAALKIVENAAVTPGVLDRLDPDTIGWLDRSLADPEQEARLAAALDRARYQPADAMTCPDDLWLKHAAAVVGTDPAAAERALLRLCDPYVIAKARLDGRFAAIVARRPGAFSLRDAVKRTNKTLTRYAKAHPDLAAPLIDIAFYDGILGRDRASIARLDAVIARPEGFTDWQGERSDALQFRAMILGGAGRWDEAMADWRAVSEEGSGESRALNIVSYAKALTDTDRPSEALSLLETARPDIPYFQVNADEARVCALQRLGRGEAARTLFATMPDRRQANRLAVFRALICLGDEDAVAAEAILQLEHPLWRQDMLLQLSDWRSPRSLSPGQARRMALQRGLASRPDVRAAIARVGRVERIDLIF